MIDEVKNKLENHRHKEEIKNILLKIKNIELTVLESKLSCLPANLKASEKGCSTPIKYTLKGPKRKPINPKILRSNKVEKATPTRTEIRVINIFIIYIVMNILKKQSVINRP